MIFSAANEGKLNRFVIWGVASLVAIVSEFYPIPGLLAAALIFPQGIHSDHAYAY
jgi:hypothetical protein